MVADYRAAGHLPADWDTLIQSGDLEAMSVKTDFLGVNFYCRSIVRSDQISEEDNAARAVHSTGVETDMGWEVHAPALKRLLKRLHRDYPVGKIVITENGCAYPAGPGEDGAVHDVRRVDYFAQHLDVCHEAIAEGVPLGGYFAWSLMDNFEWAYGYDKRFGLVHVDYETQVRTLKDSALWYRDVIGRGGLL
jgi:beta-glucosidase